MSEQPDRPNVEFLERFGSIGEQRMARYVLWLEDQVSIRTQLIVDQDVQPSI